MKNEKDNIEIVKTSVAKAPGKIKTFFKKMSSDKIKNQAFFRRGGYSLVLTALVLAGLIVFNWLVSSLADRYHLEFDMTKDKKNSISEDNLEYIESVENDVEIIVCMPEDRYVDVMISVLREYYGLPVNTYTEVEYLSQTINLLNKYPTYNDNITLRYIDPQSTEWTAISTKYLDDYNFFYGDMIVTSTIDGVEHVEVLNFDEIYNITQDTATYQYVISSNKLESALTTAIMSVTTSNEKTAAILTGHGGESSFSAYKLLLERNNYKVTEISDQLITSISSDFDIVVISAPEKDFLVEELNVISEFLDNDGKLGKGLVYFADATAKYHPTLSAWLKQWGIEVSEGILFGTATGDYLPSSPSVLPMAPVAGIDLTADINYIAIAESNVPMKAVEITDYKRKATSLMKTGNSVVVAPIGAAADWNDYKDEDKQSFDTVIQSKQTAASSEGTELSSYVMAFSSAKIIQSDIAASSELCNQDIVMLCTQQAAHAEDIEVFITEKVITDEFFTDKITEDDAKTIRTIFMFVIPFAVITVGIVVFVRRRNAR